MRKPFDLKNIAVIFFATVLGSQAATHFIAPDAATGISLGVVCENMALAHTAQLLPMNKKGELVGRGDAVRQIEQTLENLSLALRAAKSGLDHVVKINVYVAETKVVGEVEKAFAKRFKNGNRPAVSFVVGNLPQVDALVAMDAVAECDTAENAKRAKQIYVASLGGDPSLAQVSVLPKGGVVYISGQAKPGKLAEATLKTLESLQETLVFLGLKKSDVVQIKAFIQPMSEVEIAKKQIAGFFGKETIPPVIFVDWISPTLPIEIELIAAAPDNRDAKESISYITPSGFQPSNVYSKVARVNYGKLVYVSGLYGKTSEDAGKQVLEIFELLQQIIGKAGSNFGSLAKATYYVSDAPASNKLNELRPKFYDPNRPPAASKAMVVGVGHTDRSISFDMIAVSEK
jgi:enamine deaminase RidA (YjgF/YER057c/UK114 family)